MAKSNFIVRGGADFSGITREMSKTEKQFKGFEGRINKAFSGIAGGMGLNLGKLSKFALIGMATRELYRFGKASIEVASDLKETQNVVDVTFGSMSNQVNEFASNATKQFGLSELSAKKFTSTMGAMLKSSGISGQAVTDMSIEVAKLTADMASFYNLDAEEAFTKIRSGLSGETEPLKQLGINMSVANMEAFALSQGIKTAWKEMNQAEQTMLRYNYLLSVTGDAQGDFARNSGSWANQIKLLKEQWQEFMGLIGKALVEILLPVVKGLNKLLEILINVTKEIGKIYTMITGKNTTVEANNNIANSADDAADGENELADGIGKAAKAAQKALAPFDELNILQQNLGSGGGGLFTPVKSEIKVKSEINTTIDTKQVDNGLEESKKKWEGFFVWFGDKWNRLKQMLAVPITVPAPIFAAIPDPIYTPEWGLNPPLVPTPVFEPIQNPVYTPNWGLEAPEVPAPVFQQIPDPIYNPEWNLVPPPVPVVEIPAINYNEYGISLDAIKIKTAEAFESIRTQVYSAMESANLNIANALETIRNNYETHKENISLISTAISTVLVANIKQGLSAMGVNVNSAISTVQNNLQTFGRNTGNIAAETAKAWANNLSEGYKAASQNFSAFANTFGQNLKAFGSGMLSAAAETARGFVSNMVSGFSAVWNNFKNLMSSIGEEVSGWFRENKSLVLKTTIAAGIIVGAGALALAAPTIIPYAGAALGGLASIPALAKGGITNGPTLALIGDNPGGKEVVSPLDDLKDMIVSAVTSAMQQTGSSSGGSESGDLVLKIGETEFARVAIKAINAEQRRAGRTLLQV